MIVLTFKLYGAKAFKENKKIMLVVDLERWNQETNYDRLGLENHTIKFFDTSVAHVVLPVSEGRNIASLIEVAAVNARLKFLGENAAQEFADSLDQELKRKNTLKE